MFEPRGHVLKLHDFALFGFKLKTYALVTLCCIIVYVNTYSSYICNMFSHPFCRHF